MCDVPGQYHSVWLGLIRYYYLFSLDSNGPDTTDLGCLGCCQCPEKLRSPRSSRSTVTVPGLSRKVQPSRLDQERLSSEKVYAPTTVPKSFPKRKKYQRLIEASSYEWIAGPWRILVNNNRMSAWTKSSCLLPQCWFKIKSRKFNQFVYYWPFGDLGRHSIDGLQITLRCVFAWVCVLHGVLAHVWVCEHLRMCGTIMRVW